MEKVIVSAKTDNASSDAAGICTVDIPSSEQWLYDNKDALESVKAGQGQSSLWQRAIGGQ
ncbi:hypothetical protein [Candidatus Magnetobacterium casense]|uniref:Uncharacterized protein n=1 Tax=Candidatus Magnetobacterium casense TaxID=1455061 RepID=A0ABS6S0J4_9BACT|nr:hypothetical protein [Candidatus Magnetobacterium casensis]MBV6342100.1 hypothetical protein [Candidatus Magnetobacterium casensis]